MLKNLLRERVLILLAGCVILIKIFSLNSLWVERYYTYGFYTRFSSILRFLFGRIPFSIGDLLYLLLIVLITMKLFKAINFARKKQLKKIFSVKNAVKYAKMLLLVYILFQVFWGLNYHRKGISEQLALNEKPYTTAELFTVAERLRVKINFYAPHINSSQRKKAANRHMFDTAAAIFNRITGPHPFLRYQHLSGKSSLFSGIGHFVGFTGYYNPFTGEAQLNYTVPNFVKPFIVSHEIAHQLGYAKENEASFVAYLACSRSANVDFAYSMYLELYRNAIAELKNRVRIEQINSLSANLHPQVLADLNEWKEYVRKHRNFIEPIIGKIYDRYLKLNNQPKGKATYNEVLVWLVAYLRKHGVEAL